MTGCATGPAQLGTPPVYHRKLWEDCFVLQVLWEAGMLAPGRRALGFAVGREALPAILAAHGVEVLATDLDGSDERARDWIETGQHGSATEGLYRPGLLDRATFDALVGFRPADMSRLPADLLQGGFDLVWSVCALEHLGSLDRGLAFVEAAMRCLKPGGIAVHTTEFNLDGEGGTLRRGSTVLYQRRHLDALAGRLAAAGHRMLPLDDGHGEGMLDRFVDLPPRRRGGAARPGLPAASPAVDRGLCRDLGRNRGDRGAGGAVTRPCGPCGVAPTGHPASPPMLQRRLARLRRWVLWRPERRTMRGRSPPFHYHICGSKRAQRAVSWPAPPAAIARPPPAWRSRPHPQRHR